MSQILKDGSLGIRELEYYIFRIISFYSDNLLANVESDVGIFISVVSCKRLVLTPA